MELRYSDDTFYCISKFDEKDIPKSAGFWWDPEKKRWHTKDITKALKLAKYAQGEAQQILQDAQKERAENLEKSAAINADIYIPAPDGENYLPFQKAGIAWAKDHRNTLIADEMGLGKTIQAIGTINIVKPKSVLIVCPASLKLNWKNECQKWLVGDYKIRVINGTVHQDGDILIINYDILSKHQEILNYQWDMLVVDECHKCKNPKTKRSQALYSIKANYKIMLTGTPILNRPIELQPILNYLEVPFAKHFFGYAKRYCNATPTAYGWDFGGASHLEELQEKLRTTVMIRRLKKDVLKELPAKRRQVVALDIENGMFAQIEKEKKFMDRNAERVQVIKERMVAAKFNGDEESYKRAVEELKDNQMMAFTEMAALRHETARLKAPRAAESIIDAVEAEGKVVVFAHHKDVIDIIEKALISEGIKVVVVTGDTKLEVRQANVDAFQNDPSIQVFLGSIQACGVGITLTAASTAIFVELDWVPSNMNQAEDRIHRIGQLESVLIQHIVVDDSIDSHLAKTLLEKQRIIDAALDNEIDVSPIQFVEIANEVEKKSKQYEDKEFTEEEKQILLYALRKLSMVCDGARVEDGMGYNAMDTRIGKSLAAQETLTNKQAALAKRMVRKYKGQLGDIWVKIYEKANG